MKKYFRVSNQNVEGFGNEGGFSIISIKVQNNKIYVQTLRGMDLTIGGLLACLKYFPRELTKAMSEVKRISSSGYQKRIKTGYSGCRTFYLTILEMIDEDENIYYRRTTRALYLSCFNKLSYYEGYLPNILIFLPDLKENIHENIRVKELKPIDIGMYNSDEEEEIATVVSDLIGDYQISYIQGKHESGEIFTWELPEEIKVRVGDKAIVDTCYGDSEVEVISIFQDSRDFGHRKVKYKEG